MIQDKSWEITDEFWEAVKDLLVRQERNPQKEYKRKPGGGRKTMDLKQALAAVFYVLRTGIQWKALPKEYGASSAVHRYFQLWVEHDVFLKMWQRGLMEYEELSGIRWEWQSLDGSTVKAPLGQEAVGANPTDRGKKREQTAPAGRRRRDTALHRAHGSKRPRRENDRRRAGWCRDGTSRVDRGSAGERMC